MFELVWLYLLFIQQRTAFYLFNIVVITIKSGVRNNCKLMIADMGWYPQYMQRIFAMERATTSVELH